MYVLATPIATASGNVFPVNNDLRRQIEIKTYQNDLKRLEEKIDLLSLQHGICLKWELQGLKAYDHDKRRKVELEIQEKMRAAKAIRTQIEILEAR